ncbi:MAG: alpha/beta fold hydrolase [Edaphocola sp.]
MKAGKRKIVKPMLACAAAGLVGLNVIASFHAYRFTHFSLGDATKTANPNELGFWAKISTLLTGVRNPRPQNKQLPAENYGTLVLQSNVMTECWWLPAYANNVPQSKGSIALFHGYSGSKATMLDKAAIFRNLGYNVLLVDFMGSGGSEGNVTTIGYKEAEQVRTAFEYLKNNVAGKIYLFGTSMGAAAVMKAISDYHLQPRAIMVECPFGTMYGTVAARFRQMGAPAFPLAGLLVFWGGAENGFWAFGHNPENYASHIDCPVLLMYGGKDPNVSKEETEAIFDNLKGPKTLKIYPEAGHENYLLKYRQDWSNDVTKFLKSY